MKWISAQEGFKQGRKSGWCRCDDCGLGLNFSDKEIVKEHMTGEGCARFRETFGIPAGSRI